VVEALEQVLQARQDQMEQQTQVAEQVAVLVVVVLVVQAALALSSFHTQTYMRRQHLQQVHQL